MSGESRAVTVGVAAIAENGKAIVGVADRAIAFVRPNQGTVLKRDSAVDKIHVVAPGWIGIAAGDLGFGWDVLKIHAPSDKRQYPQRGMPECVKTGYQRCRMDHMLDAVLRPRMLDKEWYDEGMRGEFKTADFFASISDLLAAFDPNSTILLFGFENGAPGLYLFTNPGEQHLVSPDGFGIIGIGEDIGRHRMFALGHSPQSSLAEALYDTYDAKETCAHFVPDIGHAWDAVVLMENRQPVFVPGEIKQVMERLYNQHPRSPFHHADQRADLQQLEEWTAIVLSG
jgi:hypothetical protein